MGLPSYRIFGDEFCEFEKIAMRRSYNRRRHLRCSDGGFVDERYRVVRVYHWSFQRDRLRVRENSSDDGVVLKILRQSLPCIPNGGIRSGVARRCYQRLAT